MVLATKNNIAQVYASEERYGEAISLFETVIREYRENSTEDSAFLATVYDNLSTAYREMERYEDAIDICTEGLNIRKDIYGKRSLDYAIGSAVIFCNGQKIFREISVSAFHSAQTDNAGITLSNLKHGDHSVIMTSSDHSELDKISISLSEFPQCEVYFFISSHLFC